MKNTILKVIAPVAAAAVIGTAASISSKEYPVEIQEKLNLSDQYYDEAYSISCEYVTSLNLDCLRKDMEACQSISSAKQEHEKNFGSVEGCTQLLQKQGEQSSEPISLEPQDPTFFGDEEEILE